MIAQVKHKTGQTIYDLCLQVYGTLDLLVKFCTDNGVTDMSAIPQQANYSYDTTFVKYEGNKNIYSTGLRTQTGVCSLPAGLRTTSVTFSTISVMWDLGTGDPANSFDIGYTTDRTPPADYSNITGSVNVFTVTELTPLTSYYVWLRRQCVYGGASLWVWIAAATTEVVIPDIAGCITLYRSDRGVTLAGPVVTKWDDQTIHANNTNATGAGTSISLAPGIFGSEPALRFNGRYLLLPSAVVGFDGGQAITAFIVHKVLPPVTQFNTILQWGPAYNTVTDAFVVRGYEELSQGKTYIDFTGDVGDQSVKPLADTNKKHLTTIVFNKAATDTQELVATVDGTTTNGAGSDNDNDFGTYKIQIGGSSDYTGLNGFIAFIALYNGVLSHTDVTAMQTALAAKYSL